MNLSLKESKIRVPVTATSTIRPVLKPLTSDRWHPNPDISAIIAARMIEFYNLDVLGSRNVGLWDRIG
ncbi:hypothetical protein M0R45_024112 [Rubus argutus]|uniref:Uncharacterized protein n=1 Tax=Rubus argutus TaxID=59490 RepID=A0AAW1WPY0_RUBAR